MKKFTLVTAVLMMIAGPALAQPPEREGNRGERPAAGEGQPPERGGRGEGRRGRGPRDEQPPGEGGRGEGRGGFGGRRGFGGPDGQPPGGRGAGFIAMFPVMAALDADKNGELSAEEIANASEALKQVDKNNDGKIDATELRPTPPEGGFGGRPGFGSPRGDRPEGDRPQGNRRPPMEDDASNNRNNADEFVARMMNFDKNDDGKLTMDEVPERAQEMLKRADSNSDDTISREELVTAAQRRMRPESRMVRPQAAQPPGAGDRPQQPRMTLEMLLERFDKNQDGELSGDEIPGFLSERMERVDTNSDGKISKEELSASSRQRGPRGGDREGAGRPGGDRPERPRSRPTEDDGK